MRLLLQIKVTNRKKVSMKAWEEIYKVNRHMATWPWSDIVSDVMILKPSKNLKVLEIGCGPGANIPFFLDI